MSQTPTQIRVIDSHTGGEPTRVVVEGGPDLGGGTMVERRTIFRERFDEFRSAVVGEPRGSEVLVGALLCKSSDPSCVAGVIFFNNIDTIGMCGHGTIGVGVTLAHLGRIGSGRHRLETPVGVVAIDYDGGHSVAVENVPSYRSSAGVTIDVEGFGPVSGDVAWGGNWFFLVGKHGQNLDLANVAQLTDFTWRIRRALERRGIAGVEGEPIDHIELFGPPRNSLADSRNFVLCPGGAYDRSPCGTGTSAKLACLVADGKFREGQIWRQESITGSIFECTACIASERIIPTIRGSAFVTAETVLLFDPDDPLRSGIRAWSTGRGHAIVVGGGLIGAASAHYLSQSGWQVTIVEQNRFGSGCSHGNCGFISPSHVLPLAAPGAARMAIKSLLTPNSPFKIKPRFDASLWSWLWRFMRRCNERDMLESAAGIQPLLASSRKLYDELFARESLECEWQAGGLLFVFRTAAALEEHVAADERIDKPLRPCSKRFDTESLLALEPALKPGLAGGLLYENDGHLRPDLLMEGWRKVLDARGVRILEECRVEGLAGDSGTVRALTTSQGPLPADAFVFAMGAWTPLLNQHLGCKIPIQPGKGYSLTMPRPAVCPRYPLLLEEDRVAVTPMLSGYRLGSTMEFAGYDATLNPKRLNLLRRGASRYLREPYCEPVLEAWCGWRPMTYDSRPIIDRSPAWANVWIAAGHNMLGLSMAPATGRLIAELVSDQPPHLDVRPYRATRF